MSDTATPVMMPTGPKDDLYNRPAKKTAEPASARTPEPPATDPPAAATNRADAGDDAVPDRYARPPKSDRRKIVDGAFSLALVAAGVTALVVLKNLKEPARPVNRVSPAPLVEVADVTRHVGGLDVLSDGIVVPYRLVNVGAEVGGRVVSMDPALRSGRYVTAGQPLLTIDPETYRLEVKRLGAEVRSAESSLAELAVQTENAKASVLIARKDAELAEAETAREERLLQQRSGSQAAVEQARRAELQAKDKLQTAANSLRLLNAQKERLEVQKELTETNLERAQLDLDRTVVTSPVDGVIVTSDVERGSQVQQGGALFTVSDSDKAEVRTNLRVKDVAWILAHPPEGTRATDRTPGLSAAAAAYALPSVPVTVNYELAGNTYTWRGTLSRVDGAGLDERTRTVPCLVQVDDPQSVSMAGGSGALPIAAPPTLATGMYVNVQVHTEPAEALLEVPEEAVRPGNRVWAVRDGKLMIVELPVAAIVGGKVLIPPTGAALQPGDRVVTSPLPSATPGMSVRVAGDPTNEGGGAKAEGGGDAAAPVPGPSGVAAAEGESPAQTAGG
ncbi:efflux RND transporter periplasmic adaptor subunit [Alienimonas californiensis]|uniref:Multidrug resistance protein MdtE n=1 Tax=Alienimonas californiensis TaxID=2527989 RepID=A0A517P4Z3_9PLAN|nr:HlyD family efflux transporter periplasmic adaptor subunit [Alienimonas californiensis]QDT14439.1 Multidrug resistance protein MdtE precursor [Alienimonas californiensis]